MYNMYMLCFFQIKKDRKQLYKSLWIVLVSYTHDESSIGDIITLVHSTFQFRVLVYNSIIFKHRCSLDTKHQVHRNITTTKHTAV